MYVYGTLTHFLLTFNKRKCVSNSWTTCFCYYSFDVSIFRMCRFSSDSQPQTKSGIFQIFFRRAQKSDRKPLCRIVVSPPSKMKDLLCCLSRHRKWTLQKSQGTPGRQITGSADEKSPVWLRYLWLETWKWQLFLSIWLLCVSVCVSVCLGSHGRKCTGRV